MGSRESGGAAAGAGRNRTAVGDITPAAAPAPAAASVEAPVAARAAQVSVVDPNGAGAARLNTMLKPKTGFTAQDIAEMAGAPEGTTVRFDNKTLTNNVQLSVEGPGIASPVKNYIRKIGGMGVPVMVMDTGLVAHSSKRKNSEALANQVKALAKNNVNRIDLFTDPRNGAGRADHVEIARLGFNARLTLGERNSMSPTLRAFVLKNGDSVQALQKSEEGKRWWRANGGRARVYEFDTRENSESRRALNTATRNDSDSD